MATTLRWSGGGPIFSDTIAQWADGGPYSYYEIYSLFPSLLINNSQLYSPSVTTSYQILPGKIDSTSVIYSPTVTVGSVELTVPFVINNSIIYPPVISVSGVTISPPILVNTNILYNHYVTGLININIPLLSGINLLYSPIIINEFPTIITKVSIELKQGNINIVGSSGNINIICINENN